MKKFNMPRLNIRNRVLLYFTMILSAALALANVALECFSFVTGIVIYVLAACSLFSSAYYLFFDIRDGMKNAAEMKSSVIASNPFVTKLVENPYINKVASDYRLRTVVFAVPGLMGNVMFAVFNAVVGIVARSAWFGSLAAYYILLSMMRIEVVEQEKKISAISGEDERLEKEIGVYRKSSILFIVMAFVLFGMVLLLENSMGGKEYPGFTIYVAAMYAFYKIIKSTIDIIKIGKQKSPLLSTIKRIGHIDACVSILTLQTAMFASFGAGQEMLARVMNDITGTVVYLIVLFLGIQGLVVLKKEAKKRLRNGKDEVKPD